VIDLDRGLTGRGRGFVLAGLLLCMEGWLVGHPDLLPLGVLLLSLPLLGLTFARRARFRLAAARAVLPARVPLGASVQVTLQVTNLAKITTGLLLLTDHIPPTLGTARRFVVSSISPQSERVVSYELPTTSRGRRTIGPLRVRVVDPFGLVSLDRSFNTVDHIVVQPRVESLRGTDRAGRWAGGGDVAIRAVVAAGSDDVVPRDYRTGDELRRVHWRATARFGELMVRREEQPWRTKATILLDTRASAHFGSGPAASFEWLVSAAASITLELLHRGFVVDLIDHTGTMLCNTIEPGTSGSTRLLDRLAELDNRSEANWPERRAPDGLTVALLGRLSRTDAATLAGWRSPTGTAFTLALDTTTWAAPTRANDISVEIALTRLQQSGWRGQVVSNGTTVANAWAGLLQPTRASVPTRTGVA
jgi:uncharacterized protein (DUF58 family)